MSKEQAGPRASIGEKISAYLAEVNALLFIFLLLHHEDVVVEVVLQLLVGDVDAHLLEAVPLEVLKPEDIQ